MEKEALPSLWDYNVWWDPQFPEVFASIDPFFGYPSQLSWFFAYRREILHSQPFESSEYRKTEIEDWINLKKFHGWLWTHILINSFHFTHHPINFVETSFTFFQNRVDFIRFVVWRVCYGSEKEFDELIWIEDTTTFWTWFLVIPWNCYFILV